jgi:hypothetical protein
LIAAVFVIAEVFAARKHHLISDSETLISQYLNRIEQVDDTNLKCMLSDEYYSIGLI